MSESPAPRQPRSRRRIALALVIGAVASLALCETVLRLGFVQDGMFRGSRPLPPFGAITNPRQAEWLATWLGRKNIDTEFAFGIGGYSADLGWKMAPSRESSDGRYRTGALSARGPREYAPRAAADTLRLVCFGDSFTFCDEVGDDETWQRQLELKTAENSVEALNFGCGGYGTDQALLRFREQHELGRIEGTVATMGIMLENIGRNVNRYRPLYYPQSGAIFAKPRFVLDESGSLQLIPLPFSTFRDYLEHVADGSILEHLAEHEHWSETQALGPLRHLATARLAYGYFAYRARAHRTLWEAIEEEPAQVTLALLEAFRDEARSAGAIATPIIIFPAQTDLESVMDEGKLYWAKFIDALRARELPFVDVSAPLVRLCKSQGRSAASCYAGGHLNAEANTVVADAILDWLAMELPAGRGPRLR